MNMTRTGLGAVSIGKRIYAIGGGVLNRKGLKILDSVEYADVLDDGQLGEWKFSAPLNIPRIYISTVIYGDYVYIMGGETLDKPYTGRLDEESPALLDSVERVKILPDGNLGEWILEKEKMHFARRGGELFVYNGWLYAVGGYNGEFLNDVERAKINADGSLGEWIKEKNLINGVRYISGYVSKGNRFYVLGGHLHSAEKAMDSVNTAEVRPDSTITEWKEATPMNTRRFLNSALIMGDNTIYSIGGQNSVTLTSTERAVILKDGTLTEWIPDTPTSLPRRAAAAVGVGDAIYIMGGDLGHMDMEFSLNNVESASVVSGKKLGYWATSGSSDVEAYKVWKESIPFDVNMHLKKAKESLSEEKYDRVLFDTSEAIAIYPDSFEAYNLRGNAYYMMGKFDLAIEALKKSLSIKEDNVDVLIGLGTVSSDMGNFSEAMAYLKKAVHFKPDSVAIHNNLGNIYLSVGDYTSATKEFQWILNKNPDSKEAKRMLSYSIKSQERMEKERKEN